MVAGASEEVTQQVSRDLQRYFNIKDLGDDKHYLSIQIARKADGFFVLCQKGKITKLLEEYGLLEPRPTATPMKTGFLNSEENDSPKLPHNSQYRKAISSLLYIATISRLDIALTVGILSRCVEKPTERD